MSDELANLLRTPPPARVDLNRVPKEWTPRRDVSSKGAEITAEAKPAEDAEWDQESLIRDAGLDPADWEVSDLRKGSWQRYDGEWLETIKLSLRPRSNNESRPDLSDLLEVLDRPLLQPITLPPSKGKAFVVATGDWQAGKVDGDGALGTVGRIRSALALALYRFQMSKASDVHIAFLGDEIEGFNSQGGANTWRTGLSLTEQIRLTRRLMLAHVEAFAPLARRVTVVAVPSNHGQAVRVAGKGVTAYADDHGVEALISVHDALALSGRYANVEVFVPAADELTVSVEVAGTHIAHAHGHQWSKGKHWDFLNTSAGNRHPVGSADVLLAGHHHHLLVQEQGPRTYLQIPAMESESTWWRHRTGQTGSPGVLTFLTADGAVSDISVLR